MTARLYVDLSRFATAMDGARLNIARSLAGIQGATKSIIPALIALRTIGPVRWEEVQARSALYHARTIMGGSDRHCAVTRAKQELRRIRKLDAARYR